MRRQCPELAVGQHQGHSWHVLVKGAIRLRAEGRKGAQMAEVGHVEGGAGDASANRFGRGAWSKSFWPSWWLLSCRCSCWTDSLDSTPRTRWSSASWSAPWAPIGGTHRMLYLAPAIGLAAGLGAFTAYDWWWVGLLALVGVVTGAGIGFGWMRPLLMIPLVAAFASPVSSRQHAVAYGVIAAVATGYGIVLARRFGAAAVVEGQRVRAAHATVVALVFGAIVGGAAAIGVALRWTQPYWVPEPILLLALYVLIGRRDRILGKASGTAVGASLSSLLCKAVVLVIGRG